MMKKLPEKKPQGHWVQTERAAHEAWANLTATYPKAAQLMHILTARVGEHNAVVVSQRTLGELMICSRRTVQRAVDTLVQHRWIEVRQIGENGTVNAHILNDRVVWSGPRDGIRFSLFSATVIVSDQEQPDRDELDQQEPLRRLPEIDEHQLPAGPGLPPPSQPFLKDMEPSLPAIPATLAGNPQTLANLASSDGRDAVIQYGQAAIGATQAGSLYNDAMRGQISVLAGLILATER